MTVVLERDAATTPVLAAPARRRRLPPVVIAALLVVAGVAASLVLAAPRLASFGAIAPRAAGAPYVTVPEYGANGAYILGYQHAVHVRLSLPVSNSGPLPLTVTSVELGGGPAPMIAVRGIAGLPVTLWPGRSADIRVSAVLTNCRYFHERAMQIYTGVTLRFRSMGRDGVRVVPFDRPVFVKSPMLVGCPGRKLDRSIDNRSDLL
jgi:hypothetical protein